jgi:type II secretory pathway component PulJ
MTPGRTKRRATRTPRPPASRSRRTAPASRRAFTLIEILLAVVLVVALMGTLLAFYRSSLEARADISRRMELLAAERILMDRLTNELRTALVYPFIQTGLDGSNDRMTFITATLPGPAVWTVRKITEDPPPAESDLQLVGYRLRVVEFEPGAFRAEGLERTCQKIIAVQTAEEGKEISVALLTSRIRFLNLRYWDGADWVTSWGGGLPKAVEVTLGEEPLPEGLLPEEYPYATFRRVIYVPGASAGAAPRATVGGAGGTP